MTSRDTFLVDINSAPLKTRIADYFNADLSHDEIARRYPRVMKVTGRFNPRPVRDVLLTRGGPDEVDFVRYSYRPFDNRCLYWEGETKLLDERRAEYKPHVFEGNKWLVIPQKQRREWSPPTAISNMGDINYMDGSTAYIPLWLRDDGIGRDETLRRSNLSPASQRYLKHINASVEDLFHHVLAVLHDPAYREANAGALRMEWPRIPLPGWPTTGSAGILPASDAASDLAQSAARGRELAALLDPDTSVPGVTTGTLRLDIATIAVPATVDGRNMTEDDFALTAGWGHYGTGDAVMPGQGRIVERDYTAEERATLGDTGVLGQTTFDIYLNGNAYWRNVPAVVWRYKLGGYQVLKKWLSYRERGVLRRALMPEEVGYFAEVARRIGAIVAITDTPAVSDHASG